MTLVASPCTLQRTVSLQWRGRDRGFLAACEELQHFVAGSHSNSVVSIPGSGMLLRPLVLNWRKNLKTVSRRSVVGVGGIIGAVASAAFVWALTAVASAMAGQREPQLAIAATRKGMKLFAQGDVRGSLEKFDEALKLDSQQSPYLWQRGLSLYYLDRFEEGAKQFRDDVAVNPNDTEESIWCFLCEAQIYGVEEARRRFLVVGPDRRPVMRKIYHLFRYGGSTDEVLKVAGGGDRANFFYANLYIGLYHEAHKDQDAAKEAILAAVHSPYGASSGDYMATLASVHAECRGWKISSASNA